MLILTFGYIHEVLLSQQIISERIDMPSRRLEKNEIERLLQS